MSDIEHVIFEFIKGPACGATLDTHSDNPIERIRARRIYRQIEKHGLITPIAWLTEQEDLIILRALKKSRAEGEREWDKRAYGFRWRHCPPAPGDRE